MTLDLEAIEARIAEAKRTPIYIQGDRVSAEVVNHALHDREELLAEVRRLQTENADLREGYTRESAGALSLREKVAVMDRLLNEPRYSTEAVDALLDLISEYVEATVDPRSKPLVDRLAVFHAFCQQANVVRASREPPR